MFTNMYQSIIIKTLYSHSRKPSTSPNIPHSNSNAKDSHNYASYLLFFPSLTLIVKLQDNHKSLFS